MTTATISNKVYRFIGTTDEVTECSCCGRRGLKMTVVLKHVADGEDGEFVFFGSQCAARAMGWAVKDVNAAAKAADKDRRAAIRAALTAHHLDKVINDEIAACNRIVPRMTFSERKPHILRWNELREQIRQEVAQQFGVSIENLYK